jgi:hypothetical protein
MKIKAGDLEVSDNKIKWKFSDYKIDDIKHIYFYQTLFQHRLNGMLPAGESSRAELRIEMDSGAKIKVEFDERTFIKFYFTNKQEAIEALNNIYSHISAKTFVKRATPIATEYDKYGYFKYDNCKFIPEGRIVVRKGIEYRYDEYKWDRYYRHIYFTKRNIGLLGKLANEFKWDSPGFDIGTDYDVIMTIIDKTFGIKWAE